jgi:hypothetical protein
MTDVSFPETGFGKTCPTLKPSVSVAPEARTNIPTSSSPKTPILVSLIPTNQQAPSPKISPTFSTKVPVLQPASSPTTPTLIPTNEQAPSPIISPTFSTKVPVLPPASSPHHVICFSGNNLVEVKDRGSIPMTQLRIGDFVKSGDGRYTQVYGFGHLDVDREVLFIKIVFGDDDDGIYQTKRNDNLSYIEISPDHLIYAIKTIKYIINVL